MARSFLPYGRQVIDDDDVAAVVAVLRGDWLTTGPAVDAFEAALAQAVGARHAVAVSSGTAALHLAMMAADMGPGDVAVVPSITFVATANAARYVGADVVFADVDPETGLSGPAHFADAIARAGGGAKVLLPVHLGGQCDSLPEIAGVAGEHGAIVVEDACHALGTVYDAGNGTRGSVGDCLHGAMACFSFHPVKTVAMGEGGAVTTNDDRVAVALKRLRSHGLTREAGAFANRRLAFDAEGRLNPWHYELREPGFNYRASDIHCALGLSQLGKLDASVSARRRLVHRYETLLAPYAPEVRLPARTVCEPGWHLCQVLIEFDRLGMQRGELMRRLSADGIGTQVHYIPVHTQPYYAGDRRADLPGARAFYERCLSLPLFPAMADGDVDFVVERLLHHLGIAA